MQGCNRRRHWWRKFRGASRDVPFRVSGESSARHSRENLTKGMSSYLSLRVESKSNIEILPFTEIRRISGVHRLEEVELQNLQTGEPRTECV